MSAVEVARRVSEPFACDWVELFADEARLAAVTEEIAPLVHPELETTLSSGVQTLGLAEHSVGVQKLTELFREWLEGFEVYLVESYEYRELPDGRVLSWAPTQTVSSAAGIEMRIELAQTWTVEDGRVTALELFMNRADAEAAGSP